jgi:hypothetical protein
MQRRAGKFAMVLALHRGGNDLPQLTARIRPSTFPAP